jgi:L-ascorbate peroxidase
MSCFECFAGICGGGAYAKKKATLKKAQGLVVALVKEKSCAPILVRTAWHDSGTYDQTNKDKPWPNAGGAIGSIRTDHEINAGPNAGLKKALTSYLQPIKDACGDDISWADLIQLASATAIEVEGGPKIPMKYGRVDGVPTDLQPPPFGLPGVCLNEDPVAHLKYVFYKYGMDDKDIVALSGAHTIGRAFADRSGTVKEGSMGPFTEYTKRGCPYMANSLTAGGRSWTKNWTKFDNSYFTDMAKKDPECIAFPTDTCLMTAPEFKVHFDAFAKDQKAFFDAYKVSHKKLSELGAKFEPPQGLYI